LAREVEKFLVYPYKVGEIKEHLILPYTFQALLDCGSNPYMCKKLKITYLRKCKDPEETN
jgi:hypothetical protein